MRHDTCGQSHTVLLYPAYQRIPAYLHLPLRITQLVCAVHRNFRPAASVFIFPSTSSLSASDFRAMPSVLSECTAIDYHAFAVRKHLWREPVVSKQNHSGGRPTYVRYSLRLV